MTSYSLTQNNFNRYLIVMRTGVDHANSLIVYFHIINRLLERHKYSTQMFIPMVQPTKEMFLTMNAIPSYYVIVALNDPITDKPDWSTLCAFQATTVQAFNYNAGVWHHPMVGLGSTIDFVCLVWERREFQTEQDEDTEEVHLAANEYILLQPYSPKMEHFSVSILQ
ncbi:hypothetical protein RTP6_004249 [Batrachochytrium dendrobatidis]